MADSRNVEIAIDEKNESVTMTILISGAISLMFGITIINLRNLTSDSVLDKVVSMKNEQKNASIIAAHGNADGNLIVCVMNDTVIVEMKLCVFTDDYIPKKS